MQLIFHRISNEILSLVLTGKTSGLVGALGLFGAHQCRDKALDEASLTAAFDIEEAQKREDQSADEIDEQIADGVDDADIDISAQAEGLLRSVRFHEDHIPDLIDSDRRCAAGRVEKYGMKRLDNCVLLHIHSEEVIHGKFKKFPYDAYGHGKTESEQRQIEWRKGKFETLVSIQNIDQRKADGGA